MLAVWQGNMQVSLTDQSEKECIKVYLHLKKFDSDKPVG